MEVGKSVPERSRTPSSNSNSPRSPARSAARARSSSERSSGITGTRSSRASSSSLEREAIFASFRRFRRSLVAIILGSSRMRRTMCSPGRTLSISCSFRKDFWESIHTGSASIEVKAEPNCPLFTSSCQVCKLSATNLAPSNSLLSPKMPQSAIEWI